MITRKNSKAYCGCFRMVIYFVIILFTSCRIEIETLEVKNCIPANGTSGIPAATSIQIKFNNSVNCTDAESLFTLQHDGSVIEGHFSWVSGSSFIFTPVTSLEENGRYVISVPRTIRDMEGNTMGADYISDFYIGSDFTNPMVLSSTPEYSPGYTPGVAVTQDIIINFSKSMNRDKTESEFTMSPEVSGYFQWSDSMPGLQNSRLTFVLTKPMQYGKLYKLRLGRDVQDSSGNSTGSEYVVHFMTGNDYDLPSVVNSFYGITVLDDSAVNSGISKTGSIRIRFTENMNRQSVEKAVRITPAVQLNFDWMSDMEVNIYPVISYEPEKRYQLSIETSCMDQDDYNLSSRYTVEFITDAPDSLQIKTGTISGSNNNIDYNIFVSSWSEDIDMGGGINSTYYIRVEFMSSILPAVPAEMDFYSIYDNCIIETFCSTGGSPLPGKAVISDIIWVNSSTAVIKLTGMTNISRDIPALYRLTITGEKDGVKDINNNYMKEDYVVEFREVL